MGVVPAATSAAAGEVTFRVTNKGPEDIHEFVVLKTDLGPGALPVDADGAVTETGAGIEVIGEIEDIPVGQTQDLTVTLVTGKYVLLCNIYDATEKEAHYTRWNAHRLRGDWLAPTGARRHRGPSRRPRAAG